MRIVHLVEDLKRGGMEKLIADIVRGQRAAGHEVAIVCLRGRGETADELRDDGFAVSLIGATRVRPAGLYAVRRTLRGFRADVAHLHGMPAGTFGRLALLGTGTKTLFHVHTQISIAHLMRPALARRERMLARLPGVILAISESVRRDLIDEIYTGEESEGTGDVEMGEATRAGLEEAIPEADTVETEPFEPEVATEPVGAAAVVTPAVQYKSDAVSSSLTAMMVVAVGVMWIAGLAGAALVRGVTPALIQTIYTKLWIFTAGAVVVGILAAVVTYLVARRSG